jgi:hypothetical protein
LEIGEPLHLGCFFKNGPPKTGCLRQIGHAALLQQLLSRLLTGCGSPMQIPGKVAVLLISFWGKEFVGNFLDVFLMFFLGSKLRQRLGGIFQVLQF